MRNVSFPCNLSPGWRPRFAKAAGQVHLPLAAWLPGSLSLVPGGGATTFVAPQQKDHISHA